MDLAPIIDAEPRFSHQPEVQRAAAGPADTAAQAVLQPLRPQPVGIELGAFQRGPVDDVFGHIEGQMAALGAGRPDVGRVVIAVVELEEPRIEAGGGQAVGSRVVRAPLIDRAEPAQVPLDQNEDLGPPVRIGSGGVDGVEKCSLSLERQRPLPAAPSA
ncbi:hypothetical protein D3C80_1013870 [compost metagenome]